MNIAALKRAVAASAAWRGSLVGNPDPGPLEAFDLEIAKQRKAVTNAERIRREHAELRIALHKLIKKQPACSLGFGAGPCGRCDQCRATSLVVRVICDKFSKQSNPKKGTTA